MNSTLVKPRCAYAHNLMDNSDFCAPVNQRGQAAYSTAWNMTLDRWYLGDNRGAGAEVQTLEVVTGVGVRISGNHPGFTQRLPLLDDNEVYTAAYLCAGGELHCWTFLGSSANYHDLGFAQITIVTHPATLVWAALYKGEYTADTLPPYQPKGYAAELAACQRYFAAGTFQLAMPYTGIDGVAQNAYICHVVYPVPMRVQPPTVTIKNVKTWVNQSPHATTAVVNIANKDGFNSIWLSEPTNVLLQFDYEASAEL